uniref:Uncharacterized protein n=1 Tax=Rhizophora mucronata TaxID=61149 RepID=A0A2P2QKA8_RHIMU
MECTKAINRTQTIALTTKLTMRWLV